MVLLGHSCIVEGVGGCDSRGAAFPSFTIRYDTWHRSDDLDWAFTLPQGLYLCIDLKSVTLVVR